MCDIMVFETCVMNSRKIRTCVSYSTLTRSKLIYIIILPSFHRGIRIFKIRQNGLEISHLVTKGFNNKRENRARIPKTAAACCY